MPHPRKILDQETTPLEPNLHKKVPIRKVWRILLCIALVYAEALPAMAQTVYPLPPAEDTPEEILRLEEPGYGNSMVTGEKLSLGEYARLSAELQESTELAPQISPKLKNLIFLLKIRKFLRNFLPFF